MGPFEIEIATRSNDLVDALKSRRDAEVAVERRMTGQTAVLVSVALPLATVLIREAGKWAREKQATIRSQKLKIGKGTIAFEGFSPDEIGAILEKLDRSTKDE